MNLRHSTGSRIVGMIAIVAICSGCALWSSSSAPEATPQVDSGLSSRADTAPSHPMGSYSPRDHEHAELDRLRVDHRFTRGLAYQALGDYSLAIEEFRAVVSAGASDTDLRSRAQLRIARIYRSNLNDYEQSARAYETYLQQYSSPADHAQVYLELARLHQNQEAFREATETYRELIRRYPASSVREEAHYNLGVIQMDRGQDTVAIAHFKKLIEGFPTGDLADGALFRMAEAYGRIGELTKQLQAYERLIAEYPGSDLREFVLYRAVKLAKQLNNPEKAQQWTKTYKSEYEDGQYFDQL